MTGKEYLCNLNCVKIDNLKVHKIVDLYTDSLPEIILKMISNGINPIFLDNDRRILSFDEIIDAEKDLHIEFKKKGMIPLVDCGENDFIVYHFMDESWSMFNIVDGIVFNKKSNLEDLL